jgi:hypothetical protein
MLVAVAVQQVTAEELAVVAVQVLAVMVQRVVQQQAAMQPPLEVQAVVAVPWLALLVDQAEMVPVVLSSLVMPTHLEMQR